LTFQEAKTLLEHYGCHFYNGNGGSHYTISTQKRKYPTTFADHGILKAYQIKDVVRLLDEIKEGE